MLSGLLYHLSYPGTTANRRATVKMSAADVNWKCPKRVGAVPEFFCDRPWAGIGRGKLPGKTACMNPDNP
jgi:hypothetical protein